MNAEIVYHLGIYVFKECLVLPAIKILHVRAYERGLNES